jgi:hypothetical protein
MLNLQWWIRIHLRDGRSWLNWLCNVHKGWVYHIGVHIEGSLLELFVRASIPTVEDGVLEVGK